MSLIEPMFQLLFKSPHVFARRLPIPWLRMDFQPCDAFFAPLTEDIGRNRIGKSKCDEIRRAGLFPMWKVTLDPRNLGAFVEGLETEVSHLG